MHERRVIRPDGSTEPEPEPKEEPKPNWKRWLGFETVTLRAACELACDLAPRDYFWNFGIDEIPQGEDEADEIYRRAYAAWENDELRLDAVNNTLNVKRADFVRWCQAEDISLPDPLRESAPPKKPNPGAKVVADKAAQDRIDMLGAALWCLVHRPDECRNTKGKVTAAAIYRAIVNHLPLLFENRDEPPLSSEQTASKFFNEHIKPRGRKKMDGP
ncbi:MAG: hypothetical protein GC168_05120 [Candidatus Hydrogenedens sp.]|nr:hypothetical protein [Candidatus Hydrogenedens sp.]